MFVLFRLHGFSSASGHEESHVEGEAEYSEVLHQKCQGLRRPEFLERKLKTPLNNALEWRIPHSPAEDSAIQE